MSAGRSIGGWSLRVAGVDEVGRGPLAGPVVACAVVFEPRLAVALARGARPDLAGLADSKALTPARRARLRRALLDAAAEGALDWGLGWVAPSDIDRLNIHGATMLAMTRAIAALEVSPDWVRVDGRFVPETWRGRGDALVGGDRRVAEISAASILAKEARDAWMRRLGEWYPGYGFERHAGYPTPAHQEALRRLGVTPVHRRSFAPVMRWLTRDR